MRRLIICTGRVNADGAENTADAEAGAAQACLLVWSSVRRADRSAKELTADEKIPATAGNYARSYKIYQYVRFCTQALGIKAVPAPEDYKKRMKTNSGGLVTEVFPNSPAEQAGILAGDVLVSVNDVPFSGEADIEKFNYGEENRMLLSRGDEIITKNIFVPC